ncbi:sulfide dehydrogenase (flavoprotein) subunit SudB [Desulfonispora thiosulfatigenes DSM 11270]|uniref:Sulfide dehydrogenase (Flavoprotein) subunit SudB n=1 Tax=Desulfonispora thiosulfatigenes DSM 11270 TaxID=656914 RepID=A0A1W1VNM0_DESTI|nr:sulfide/dihydroorotate dehydrogenase-like FAD/NAD-binding protein [Desulfonispora thiosulfatigenes]SMB94873.1 sulfide dehydrogenase (flavoprotein) subunit SudB [Desulfonispora thiosulfatigenes DSM 11270]
MFKIVDHEQFADNLFLFKIEAPRLAKKAKAGQFVILRAFENGERIPLTIADYDREKGTIDIIFQTVGKTTKKLGLLKTGDEILDLVGPLGEPTEIENFGTSVVVGGGVGIAPIYPIARSLKEAGNKVISIIGARTKDIVFWVDKLKAVSDEVLIATDDGSLGTKGFVTDLLRGKMDSEQIDRVWAIGPMIMMRAVAEVTRPEKIKTIVSLNPIMVDGTGMCGACRVLVGDETKFACVDGPEFDAHLVDFNLAMRRACYYKEEEQTAQTSGCNNNGGGCQCQ